MRNKKLLERKLKQKTIDNKIITSLRYKDNIIEKLNKNDTLKIKEVFIDLNTKNITIEILLEEK